MIDEFRTFVVASDDAVIALIVKARKRLVVIAPALNTPVAEAVARRLHDLDHLSVTIILDSDPEVYRLGFGDKEALESIRAASDSNMFDLREQSGVRIGVVVSDEETMIYSPVSKNIEAGSLTAEKPNAIFLQGPATNSIATAAGADSGIDAPPPEIGNKALEPTKVREMQQNLSANPPKPFDITRRMNVFSSQIQYVEFSASNYRLTTRQIPLPPELVDVSDHNLKHSISSRIRAPFDLDGINAITPIEINFEYRGKQENLKVDDDWLNGERKRMEDEYTFPVKNFGRVILYNDRPSFDDDAERFRLIIEKYQTALASELTKSQAKFEARIVEEFSARWQQRPPAYFGRYKINATPENINLELRQKASALFENAVAFNPPIVKILYKNVSAENIRDGIFLRELQASMYKKKVPRFIIDTLFESGEVAPEAGKFPGHSRSI